MTEKYCGKCKETKPVDQFNKNRTKKGGIESWCRECNKKNCNAWDANNREVAAARANDWYYANKERALSNSKDWKKRNPDKLKASRDRSNWKRRAREACSVSQRWTKSACPDTNCYWCGVDLSTVEVNVDHILPIALGGPAIKSNEVPTCRDCNLSKRDKHPLVWIAQQF